MLSTFVPSPATGVSDFATFDADAFLQSRHLVSRPARI